jgi:hypothetical protein
MDKKLAAKIYWLSKEQGGRQELPVGDKYAPIIKITNPLIELAEFWSVFVINKNKLNENETLAEIEYLSDKAPDNLYKDVEFELFEGNKLVAKGIIL